MFHTLLPASAVAWWFAFAPRAILSDLPEVMNAPVIYTAFALVVGRTTGFYAYFFLDQPKLGWTGFAGWVVALALFFLAMGSALLGLRRLAGRRVSAPA